MQKYKINSKELLLRQCLTKTSQTSHSSHLLISKKKTTIALPFTLDIATL